MSLSYCYSTKSKRISIEAMLQSYREDYDFFNWKPRVCVAEKRTGRWEIYYDHESILNSQELCREIFENPKVFAVLHADIQELVNDYDSYVDSRLINANENWSEEICRTYLHYYRKLINRYTFTNEFCFKHVENSLLGEISNHLEENQAVDILLMTTNINETYSQKAYLEWQAIEEEYCAHDTIPRDRLTAYLTRYGFLYNRERKMSEDDLVRELARDKKNHHGRCRNRPQKWVSYQEKIDDSLKLKIDRVYKMRESRLKMRETMMRSNYYFTDKLRHYVAGKYKDRLSDLEIDRLISDIGIQELCQLENINILKELRKQVNVLIYTCGEVFDVDKGTDFSSVPTPHETKNRSSNTEIRGEVIFGSGTLDGTVKTFYSDFSSTGADEYIYVTKSLHPKDILLLSGVKAVIVDEGGILAHACILAREMSIPCMIGTRNGSFVLKDGDHIAVDFQTGTVCKVNNEANNDRVGFHKLEKSLQDVNRFGNKCVNICKEIGKFNVVDGFVMESDCVKELYSSYLNNGVVHLSDNMKKEIEAIFPVIMRSSSIYEDREEATAAGLLESIEAVESYDGVSESIVAICESSKSKALNLYLNRDGLDNSRFPSIIIQRYIDFDIQGTALIQDSQILIDLKEKHSNTMSEHVIERAERDHGLHCYSNENDYRPLILGELDKIAVHDKQTLVEFGIYNCQFYVLQIRPYGGMRNV